MGMLSALNLSFSQHMPAGLSPKSRAREVGRASASAAGNKRAAPLRTPLDTPDAAEPAPKRKARLKNEDASGILLSDDVLSRALCGDRLDSVSKMRYIGHASHECKHQNPDGSPCWSGLWVDREHLHGQRSLFLALPQEERSARVFHKCQNMVPVAGSEAAHATRSDFRFFVRGREVCRHSFLLEHPISSSRLHLLQERVKLCKTSAHEKRENSSGHNSAAAQHEPLKALGIVGWYQGYSEVVGCWMPTDQELIVPRRDRSDEWAEYAAAMGSDAASYGYFCRTCCAHPELEFIHRARALLNFQNCSQCVSIGANLTKALARGDRVAAEGFKIERAAHIAMERGERLSYYKRRELGRDPCHDSVSLILDKCDSTKTICPWFAQSPGAWWKTTRKECLSQHLLGVLVHGRPNHVFLYNVNDSIKGDANLNVEGIRRTLVSLYSDKPMPKTVYIQADSASDNRCWTMIAFLGMLIFHGYTKEIFISFLIVGHTHEDIDQLFSVIARFFRSLPDRSVTTPQQYMSEVAGSVSRQRAEVSAIEAVLEWDQWLHPHLVSPLPTGLARTKLPKLPSSSSGDEETTETQETTETRTLCPRQTLCAPPCAARTPPHTAHPAMRCAPRHGQARLIRFGSINGTMSRHAQHTHTHTRTHTHTHLTHTHTRTRTHTQTRTPTRTHTQVVMHYKELCQDATWLPAQARTEGGGALVTDEAGIELFQTHPPDPMAQAPSLAPFAVD